MPTILLANLSSWKACVNTFCEHYVRDLPNVSGLPAELDLWQRMWKEKEEKGDEIPDRVTSTLKVVHQASFPNVFSILQVLTRILVTSCSCEMSISSLRYLKKISELQNEATEIKWPGSYAYS